MENMNSTEVSDWKDLDEMTLVSRHYGRSVLGVEMSPEKIPTKISQASTKVLHDCAKTDGLTRKEYEFILGHQIPFAGNKADVICVLDGDLPELSEEDISTCKDVGIDSCTLYEVTMASASDNEYADAERDKLRAFSEKLNIDHDVEEAELLGLEDMMHRKLLQKFLVSTEKESKTSEEDDESSDDWKNLDELEIVRRHYKRRIFGDAPIESSTKQAARISTKILLECAGTDGLARMEYEWILGHQTTIYGEKDLIIEVLDGKHGAITAGELTAFKRDHSPATTRRILYESVLTLGADFLYGDKEQQSSKRIAKMLGLTDQEFAEVELFGMSKMVHNMKVGKLMGTMAEQIQKGHSEDER